MAKVVEQVLWRPQDGPQRIAMHDYRAVDELFMGGSRGPGKTDFLLGDYLQDVEKWGAAWRGFFCRRSYPELEEVMVRCLFDCVFAQVWSSSASRDGPSCRCIQDCGWV